MDKRFKLEKVLDFRNRTLDREKAKLTELIVNERRLMDKVAEINQEIIRKREEQSDDAKSGDYTYAEMYDKYITLKERELLKAFKEKEAASKLVEDQRVVLNKSLADVKIMDKLKEKHLIDYGDYLKKLEEKNNDEINITRQKND